MYHHTKKLHLFQPQSTQMKPKQLITGKTQLTSDNREKKKKQNAVQKFCSGLLDCTLFYMALSVAAFHFRHISAERKFIPPHMPRVAAEHFPFLQSPQPD